MTAERGAANTDGMQEPHGKPPATNLDFPLGLISAFRAGFAPGIVWEAPRRGVTWTGRDQVIEKLLREAAAMQGLQFTRLRQSSCDARIIDEFVARFTYSGQGIENLDLPTGAQVELQRLRILTLDNELVTRETAIESWIVIDGPPRRI
jgi:hypothetical protein